MKELILGEIARRLGGELLGDPDIRIHGIRGLDEAQEGQISFVASSRFLQLAEKSQAAALIVSPAHRHIENNLVVVENPYLAYARCAALFAPSEEPTPGISKLAHIGENCRLGRDISIFPMVFVGDEVELDDGVTLYPHVYVGHNSVIGEQSVLHPGVVLYPHTRIGRRVIVHAGTVIGSDGFGYVMDEENHAFKIPQTGCVRIDDDVEIGALNAIDRASMGRTWIQEGVKTDNLIQIGHNCVIGAHSLIIAQVGISGSARIGRHVVLAGQTGVAQHVTIGDNTIVGGRGGVSKNLPPKGTFSGTPIMPHTKWRQCQVIFARLPEMRKKIRELEDKIAQLEGKIS
ncbi:MAG: UDP-3-O-(3-hydroxymyristoyl)glucosamine N-acyltransferase [Deltaproteobacteria bacterium]|nr:UDP-3-O-(3-hydroxymyristoyl)glucosamine N-acyltransferase [Deltaproteobacteria bacterium]MBW2305873.1 UDP-3-O-(3-hydroxymyristoyl)glucosamine N-acyltransferase [Deltaproteobacteria bacterium]